MQKRWGPYTLLDEIGRGATGVVFRGRGPRGEDVAIKVLQSTGDEGAARFERETRLLAHLGDEEGFVPLIESGNSPSPFIVMPFVPGGTLRQRLARGPLSIDETVGLGLSLGRAMARAHESGIVHRDLKPENILFAADGRPLVADLGLAKHFRRNTGPGDSPSLSLSQPGALRGTPGYMSPEQLRDSRSVKPRADVFALGAILHECLTGSPPFMADDLLQLIARIELGRYEPIAGLRPEAPRWLVAVIERALARDPARRYADASELVLALDEGGEGAPKRDARPRLVLRLVAPFLGGAAITTSLALGARAWLDRAGPPAPPAVIAPQGPPPGPSLPLVPAPSRLESRELPEGYRTLARATGSLQLAGMLGRPEWKHCERLHAATFSPDGRTVASGGAMNVLTLTDAETGRDLRRGVGHKGWIRGLAFADAGTLLSASQDGTVCVWDPAHATAPRAVLSGHEGPVWSVAVTRDGKLAASAGADRTVRLWNLATRQSVAALGGHTDQVMSAAFTEDGARVLSCSLDGTVRTFEVTTSETRVLARDLGPLRSVAVSTDKVLVGHESGEVTLLALDGRLLGRGRVHASAVLSVAFSPDGRRFATGSADGLIRVFDASSSEPVATLVGHVMSVESVAFSPDGTTIVSSSADQTVRLWDPERGAPRPGLGAGQRSRIIGLALSPDGERALATSWEPIARLWDVATGVERPPLEGHAGWVVGAAFSPDGKRAATASSDGTARIWDTEHSRPLAKLEHPGAVGGVAWRAGRGGERLVTTCEDGRLRVWDPERGELVFATASLETSLAALALSRDGRHALVAAGDRTARLVEVDTGALVKTLAGHGARVNGVALTADGRRGFTASEDRTVRVFDLLDGSELSRYDAGAAVWTLGVSSDGRRFVATSQDGQVHVVEAATATFLERLDVYRPTNDFALSLALSLDGRRLLLGTSRGVVLAFNVRE